jgi:hypothetical protein
MNLSDDLIPAADPAPLLRAMRRRRHLRHAARAGLAVAAIVIAAAGLWTRPGARRPAIARATPAESGPPVVSASPPPSSPPPITMTRDELIDSLKDQTYALVRWPDGREQLLIRR